MRVPFTLSDESITVFVNGKMRTVLSGNANFDKLKEQLRKSDHDVAAITRLSDREEAVRTATTNVEVRNGVVY